MKLERKRNFNIPKRLFQKDFYLERFSEHSQGFCTERKIGEGSSSSTSPFFLGKIKARSVRFSSLKVIPLFRLTAAGLWEFDGSSFKRRLP